MPNDYGDRLTIFGRDVSDLTIISAMLQDAIIPVSDMAYFEQERTFVMAVNRFRWEVSNGKSHDERVHASIKFGNVTRAQYRNFKRGNSEDLMSILSIGYDAGVVLIQFSGNSAVRLVVSEFYCIVRDLDEPWPTIWRPSHSGKT